MTTPAPTAAEALRYRDERDALRSELDIVKGRARDFAGRLSEAETGELTLATENGVLRDERDDLRAQVTRLVGERDAARADLADLLALRPEVTS